MTMITAEHKGQKITYNEEKNTWVCDALKYSALSLGALKTKIDTFLSAELRFSNGGVDVISFGYDPLRDITKGKVTMLDRDNYCVWISHDKTRSKVGPHSLTPDTPEAWETIEKAREKLKQGKALIKEANDLVGGLKRFTLDELRKARLEPKPE